MNKRSGFFGTAVALLTGLAIVAAPISQGVTPLKGAQQTVSGTGDGVPGFKPIDEPVIITMTHDGASNFIVSPIGADGEDSSSWANEIGPYTGTTLQEMNGIFAPFGKKNPLVAAEVQADGNWTLQVRKLSQAPVKALARGVGSGNDVFAFKKVSSGFKRLAIAHTGSSNFIVQPVTAKGEAGISLVNEIGPYKGTVRLPAGTKYLWVQADGEWNYSVK